MKPIKIRVRSPEHSEVIQKMLFAAGYGWAPIENKQIVRHTDATYLYVYRDGEITHGSGQENFSAHHHQEVDFDWCIPERETIEIDGVKYYADEVKGCLQKLNPVE